MAPTGSSMSYQVRAYREKLMDVSKQNKELQEELKSLKDIVQQLTERIEKLEKNKL